MTSTDPYASTGVHTAMPTPRKAGDRKPTRATSSATSTRLPLENLPTTNTTPTRVQLLRSELTEPAPRAPLSYRDPAVTGSTCAICGVHVDGGQPDFPFPRGNMMLSWRRCIDCTLLCTRMRITAREDVDRQERLLIADMTGRTFDQADPVVSAWITSTLRTISYGAHLVAHEAAPGTARRWDHVDVAQLLDQLHEAVAHTERTAAGTPVPAPSTACAGCGVNRAAWWRLTKTSTPPTRLVHYCDGCTAADDLPARGLSAFTTRADRLAAAAGGLGKVPTTEEAGYAATVGFRTWLDTPGALPSSARWQYLDQTVRDRMSRHPGR